MRPIQYWENDRNVMTDRCTSEAVWSWQVFLSVYLQRNQKVRLQSSQDRNEGQIQRWMLFKDSLSTRGLEHQYVNQDYGECDPITAWCLVDNCKNKKLNHETEESHHTS